MERQILEIKGYYNSSSEYEFNDSNSWTGQILLNDDLTFEGIVVDKGKNDDRLITGTLIDYQGISLIKFNLLGFDPCSFYGFSDGEQILGLFDAMTPFRVITCGTCKILLSTSEKDKDFEAHLEERLASFRSQMDHFNKSLYKRLIKNMPATRDNFTKNLQEGRNEIEKQLDIKIKRLEIQRQNPSN